ncbi:MAG: methylmalonyl-CoA mutase family protein [Spirochaetota bacterium]|nr:methylmalonyl-CoA mutase family protein [Spirochaetota bacterium]
MIKDEELAKKYREKTDDNFDTVSGIPVKAVYTPDDVAHIDYEKDIGLPGEFPFTRGHHPQMYRGKLWNIREISGLSTPKAFNKRCHYLLNIGQGALNWEIDGPTMYGIEPDQSYAEGQLGVTGVTLHTLKDVEVLSEGLPLEQLSLSCDAFYPDVWQSYILTAKKRGCDISKLRGVGGGIFYYGPSVLPSKMDWLWANKRFSSCGRWSNDFMEYALKNMPKWNVWYTSSYDFREAGGNAIHEIAFTLAIRDEIIREMQRRGIDADTTARQLSPVIASDRDFFEEIAKMRAGRRVWAKTLKEKFGTTDPKAMQMRFHIDVSGYNFTRQQPLVNIARGTLGSLAAVLGGCLGIQNPSYDEGWATPTEEAVMVAIRSQQVIRYESGVTKVADPLAGSHYVEWLTSELEKQILDMYYKIEEMGGWIKALTSGWVIDQLSESLLDMQRKVENGERAVVGVNCYTIPPEEDFQPEVYAPDRSDVEEYLKEYQDYKKNRNIPKLKRILEDLRHAAEETEDDLVPYVFEALEAEATYPEIIGMLRMADGMEYDWAGEREYPF